MKQSGKKIDDLNTTVIKKSMKDNLPVYTILIILLVIIVICYILYKKINVLNEQNEALAKKEKEYLSFIKEQNEQNLSMKNKFNMLIEHSNHISSVINENFSKVQNVTTKVNDNTETNEQKVDITQMSKEKSIKQPEQREMMPTSIFQSSVPLTKENGALPPPTVTINKKSEYLNENYNNLTDTIISKDKIKKSVNLNSDTVILEEDSSSDEN